MRAEFFETRGCNTFCNLYREELAELSPDTFKMLFWQADSNTRIYYTDPKRLPKIQARWLKYQNKKTDANSKQQQGGEKCFCFAGD